MTRSKPKRDGDQRAVAAHDAGHAVIFFLRGFAVLFASLRPQGHILAHVTTDRLGFRPSPRCRPEQRQRALRRIKGLLAGPDAEAHFLAVAS
jgi:hypothetical protein